MEGKASSLSQQVFTFVNESFLKTIFHALFFRRRPVARLLWGMNLPPLLDHLAFGQGYSDLSGIVLRRELVNWVRRRQMRRVHEVGIGHYAIMCIYLRKRFPELHITGSTISPVEIGNSTKNARLNGFEFTFYQSDVLASFQGEPVEMIWWNLPYYDPQMSEYLRRMFAQVRQNNVLVDRGLIVLGTNTVPFSAEAIMSLAKEFDYLQVIEDKRHSWNPHAVVTIEYHASK